MKHDIGRLVLFCAALMLPTVPALAIETAAARPVWTDDFVSRLEALALLQTLNADLLSHDSATLTLDRWCEKHRLASPAHIVAELVHGADKTPTAEQRHVLGVGESDPVMYRHVKLRCGTQVLSEADNWYVPSRLTPDMNRVLTTTDTAFGRAVQALHFQRHTLSAALLWSPLPDAWEMNRAAKSAASAPLQVPPQVLQHRAVLTLPDGTPFSAVVETYTDAVLAFPQP
jgi:chorismate-pyruvate lyase